MLLSMTGQGDARGEYEGAQIAAEVRSVNNRYLKVTSRLSDAVSSLEPKLESIIRQLVRRGSIQVSLRVVRSARGEDVQLNETVVLRLAEQAKKLSGQIGVPPEVLIGQILSLPGCVSERSHDGEIDEQLIATTTEVLLKSLVAMNEMRSAEGAAMGRELSAAVDRIEARVAVIQQRAPQVIDDYRIRLEAKVRKALAELDVNLQSSDVLREVQVFADRADIREEIVRLGSHLAQFRKVVEDAESQGRKLDFLIQELFRETNTIGSKANDSQISLEVVEIKTVIEQMREIVQNIE